MFLKRNIIVDGQALEISFSGFFQSMINIGVASIFKVGQKWIPGFSFHQDQKRTLAIFALK